MRTQTKIALIFFLVSVSIILILSTSVYYVSSQYSFTDFYKRLEIRAVVMAKAVLDHEEASASVLQEVREMHLERLPEEKEYFYEITSGKTFKKESALLNLPIAFFETLIEKGEATYQNNNTFFSGIKYLSKAGSYAVIVSADNYYNSHHLSYLRNVFLVGILVSSVFSLLISIIFSRQVFNPVKEITDRVKEISSQNLHMRLGSTKVNDEIRGLETTFNNMLDRLETAFETQNNFISNASHELSTPLTTIIGESDVTLSKVRTTEEYITSLRVIQTQAERLEKITKSLLFLAQTGFTGKSENYDTIRIDQLAWDVKDTIDKLNSQNKLQINLSLMPENPEMLKIKGNEQLLHLAVSNIVNNACKYSNNQPVVLSIGIMRENVVMVVKDTGIGIPPDELKYIYDPFFRASNTKNYDGYGIGLPLTRNIVRLHKGEITVASRVNEGTTVQLIFPIGI